MKKIIVVSIMACFSLTCTETWQRPKQNFEKIGLYIRANPVSNQENPRN
ncbi:hypothetical protein [Mongoliitalea daihaiensis]|nr:hypothetical protein [Mongoliitalea daihaiensis]UJP63650.1 hypothetical protein IPZ59_12480 [Mongoliitalea daihaiensis]